MHDLARELWPLHRSLTGHGVRQTLRILQRELPPLTLHEVPSGTRCFDWTVPPEWTVRDAWLEDPTGRRLARFQDHNLHLMGYSRPLDQVMDLEELRPHLHTRPDLPDAIPFTTSYYKENWGFCLSHREYEQLRPGPYRVFIDATLAPGHLTYGEAIIPGDSREEILLSTYVCHPSMANNELSGPVVTTFLGRWLLGRPRRRFTYRLVYAPETLGAILYLSRHLDHLRRRVRAAFNLTCVGDDRAYSYLPSRRGDTLADRTALHVLGHLAPGFQRYSFLQRGSDERQYCSPGVDLPMALMMRTKYGRYPEYHTSLDDLERVVTPAGLFGAYRVHQHALLCLEHNRTWRTTVTCEPNLGSRGLWPTTSQGVVGPAVIDITNLLAHADGATDLLAIADHLGRPLWELVGLVGLLEDKGLLAEVPRPEATTDLNRQYMP
ncbi:MAG: DUF4910 domain-containing protein [Magnetococcales bacterium]|nr:DUF4910 domain-containing protein [Magnetococcales bacterium]